MLAAVEELAQGSIEYEKRVLILYIDGVKIKDIAKALSKRKVS